MNKIHKRANKGFTLLEILLVIAAIGILAAIVLVAINPNRQIAQVRNAERRSEVNTIYKAIEQYLIDTGSYPAGITTAIQDICINGNTTNCVNLGVLVPDYIANIPIDPQGVAYKVAINGANNRVSVYTSNAELGQVIGVNNTWTPANISTALWLDAADASTITQSSGAITAWADKSGNNRTATAAGNPTYNATGMSTNRPAVQLDGTGDGFVSSITGIGSFNALDVYMVTQTTEAAAPDANSAFFWAYGNLGSSSGPYLASQGLALSSSTSVLSGELIIILAENATANAGRLGSNSYARAANTAQILNSRNSTTGTSLLANGSSVTLNLANQITTSSNTAPSATGYTVDSNFHIGALRANGTLVYSPAIKFGEIIVAPTLLSTNDRQRIEGYLAWKWGLVHNLPANHPYRWDGREFGYTFSGITDTDAQTYIAGVETADGQVLENATRTAIQNFIVGAKADGIWDAIKSSAILAGARTLNGALVPLKGTAPTNFNFVSADYNRKTGLIGDGSTKRLNANRAGSADPQNSSHISVYATTATTQNKNYISLDSPGAGRKQITRPNDLPADLLTRNNSATRVDFVGAGAATGFIGTSRASSTQYTARALSSTSTLSSTSDGVSANNLFIYGDAAFADARLAFYSIGESLNLALLDTRVTQLMTDLGNAIPNDTDAQAYITAVETADGQALEIGVKNAINNFVVGCKSDGIWDAIKSSNILAGARTLNGALVPLKGTAPTNFNFVSGDYNRKTGLIGDGNTKYLDSNRNNNADPQNSRHGSVYVSTAPTTTGFSTYISRGGSNTAGSTIVQIGDPAISGSSTNHLISKVSGSATTLPGTNSQSITLGLKGVSRNTSASHTLRSGNSNFTISDTSAVPLSGNVVIYAAATPAVVAYINARLAFYSIGESLNLALLDTRVTQLITDLNNAIP